MTWRQLSLLMETHLQLVRWCTDQLGHVLIYRVEQHRFCAWSISVPSESGRLLREIYSQTEL